MPSVFANAAYMNTLNPTMNHFYFLQTIFFIFLYVGTTTFRTNKL